ncbi:MAG: GNAT family N-acetyltransferase, partial [Oscillospiraceae bacterium]|nr:GNAT family N-acetyltransferase [Oscillospiraceae bacterium]
GYLFGQECRAKQTSSVISEETPYFEIEELYVVPAHRSEGIGRKLFCFVEQEVKSHGIEFLMLSTATKDYRKILHFYIEELGMEFWSARLFKKL